MANVTDLISYYVNLLIIQYHNQPKAQATIALFAEILLANGILLDIENAYNINGDAPAAGKQLDVIGKYVGVDRFYSELTLIDYFSMITYDEVAAPPSSPPRFGFETYATFGEYDYNGWLIYDDIIAVNNRLVDSVFLVLIKLAIILDNSNFSHESIDQSLFDFFGTDIRAESTGGMHMYFFVTASLTPLIQAILFKKLLPKPMGVGELIVGGITGPMFAFTDYSGHASPFGYGFSEYSDYATLPGQVLVYSQLLEG